MLRSTTAARSVAKIAGRRFVSTGASGQTKYTTLSNGITVATEVNPFASSSTIGAYVTGGSRSEHPYSNGVSALTATLLANSKNVDGIALSAENTRETNAILAQSTNESVADAGKLIAELISKPQAALEAGDFNASKLELLRKAQAIESDPSSRVLEHLNASAFQGYSLGLPTNGTFESIKDIELQDSLRFAEKHLVTGNTVIAASGNFNHDKLVDAIESSLQGVATGSKPAVKPASFLGSEVRMRDDTLPKAWVSIAAQGEGLNSQLTTSLRLPPPSPVTFTTSHQLLSSKLPSYQTLSKNTTLLTSTLHSLNLTLILVFGVSMLKFQTFSKLMTLYTLP